MEAIGEENPFRLQPIKAGPIPTGMQFSPVIKVYNPTEDEVHVTEVFTTDAFLGLTLPPASSATDGSLTATPNPWRIARGMTSEVARVQFRTSQPGSYSGFVNIRMSSGDMIVPVEVEVAPSRGLQPLQSLLAFGVFPSNEVNFEQVHAQGPVRTTEDSRQPVPPPVGPGLVGNASMTSLSLGRLAVGRGERVIGSVDRPAGLPSSPVDVSPPYQALPPWHLLPIAAVTPSLGGVPDAAALAVTVERQSSVQLVNRGTETVHLLKAFPRNGDPRLLVQSDVRRLYLFLLCMFFLSSCCQNSLVLHSLFARFLFVWSHLHFSVVSSLWY